MLSGMMMVTVIEIEEKLATDHKNILQEVVWMKEMKRGSGNNIYHA